MTVWFQVYWMHPSLSLMRYILCHWGSFPESSDFSNLSVRENVLNFFLIHHIKLIILVSETRVELARPFLAKGFSYHTCFYTSNLNAFYYAIHFIGAGVSHLLFKILWSGLFHYHIRNVATQEPYCTTTQTHLQLHCGLAQCLRVLIIISNLGISYIPQI